MLSNPLNPNPNVVTDVNHIDGIFRGIVEDNDDPLNLCRLRVRVPYLNGMPNSPNGIPTDGLPWAAACVPYGGPGYGQVLIPEVGSTVWVMFENQAKDRPVWIGCSYGAKSLVGQRDMKSVGYDTFVESEGKWIYDDNSEDTPDKFRDTNKNSKVVIRTPKGFEISIDEADEHECFEIIDRTGQLIRMYCPVTKEGNKNNDSARTFGSAMNGDVNKEVLENAIETQDNNNYILIESQSNDNNVQPSYVKLSKQEVMVTNGESFIEMHGKNMTFENGLVQSIYSGDNNTYVITNNPGSTFQMDVKCNSITHGSSEVVVRDDIVEIDNGRVGIRLTDAIELCGPVRVGSNHGRYGGHSTDDWLRIYYPHIKLATGQSSIILDNENVTISGNTRIASGNSSITVDNDIKLSGNTTITNGESSLSLNDNSVSIDSSDTKLVSGRSSVEVRDTDKLGNDEDKIGDIVINGDTKIANDSSSIIISDESVDISSDETKIATGSTSIIVHDQYIEANGCTNWIQDTVDEQGLPAMNPNRIGEVNKESVDMDDTSKEIKLMDSTLKGDTSIDDGIYAGWYTGQHVDMIPVQ